MMPEPITVTDDTSYVEYAKIRHAHNEDGKCLKNYSGSPCEQNRRFHKWSHGPRESEKYDFPYIEEQTQMYGRVSFDDLIDYLQENKHASSLLEVSFTGMIRWVRAATDEELETHEKRKIESAEKLKTWQQGQIAKWREEGLIK